MPSNLFRQALDSLPEDEREALGRGLDWLKTHAGLSPTRPTDGARIYENLQAEAHLVGDGAFGDPAELTGFLQRCSAGLDASSVPDRHRGYEEACEAFAGRGLQVPRTHLPDGLLRYTASRALAASLIERMLGTRARDAFNRGTLPADTAFTRIQGLWDPLRLDATDRLARGNQVFATFEHPAGAPRDDATAMSQALALPLWQAPPKRAGAFD